MAHADDCGCCGAAVEKRAAKLNKPGLPEIRYRLGTQPEIKASLLARLSSSDFPALAALTTRRDDDWTIALCDAFACLDDVLTFYQERIANESYLRTATERRSILELARLIGYRLAPGVAASTAFAFTLETAPGQPELAAQPVTIPIGTTVQSIPDSEQMPQTFETAAPIVARVEWNAMAARTSEMLAIATGTTEIFLTGTSHQIQAGDAILIVGSERSLDVDSDRWDVRWLEHVETDQARDLTRLAWTKPLGNPWSAPTAHGIRAYVFRQRASLFGASAPDANLLWNKNNKKLFANPPPEAQWLLFDEPLSAAQVDLDAVYPKVVPGTWVALAGGSDGTAPVGYVELYRITAASQLSRSQFGLSAKVTRLQVDSSESLAKFKRRETQVLAQSEEVPLGRRPILYPIFGSVLDVDRAQLDLAPGQLIAVSGKRQRVALPADASGIAIVPALASALSPGESFVLLSPPQRQVGAEWQALEPRDLEKAPSSTPWSWAVQDRDGHQRTITAPAGKLLLRPALKSDPTLAEIAAIAKGADAIVLEREATVLGLSAPLENCYDRSTVAVNANVAPATHGETVAEIAGSGDASRANQAFALKQAPLTYVSSSKEADGAAATLEVRVNDLLWSERPTLYGAGERDRVYALRQDDSGTSLLQFGDGVQGARLPSGQNNVRLRYRKGLGVAGNLRGGQISTLLTRPLGVKSATNPSPSAGGQDPESLERARLTAPLRILTLDRAVSARDYADFARAFAGIAKAHAIWIPSGAARGIHVTVAAEEGRQLAATSDTMLHLVDALRGHGDELLPLTVHSFGAASFVLEASVAITDDADGDIVLNGVEAALRRAFSFAEREFGQPVTLDEVYAVIQHVEGVLAVDVRRLFRKETGPTDPQPAERLLAALPTVGAGGKTTAAELLTLDPGPIAIGRTKIPTP